MFEEEDNRDNADEDPTPTQNDAAQNDPKKKKTPAKKSPAMKVAMPDSTERVSTSYQVATTARKTSKKSATKKGGPRLTKNCRVYVKQNIVLKMVPPNLHILMSSPLATTKPANSTAPVSQKPRVTALDTILNLMILKPQIIYSSSAAEVLRLSLKVKRRIFKAEMKLKRKWRRFSQRRIMPMERTAALECLSRI
jgi:hypothetical protein